MSCAIIHEINTVLPPSEVTGHNGGYPIPENKLAKMDGLWYHIKEILGWIMDGANFIIRLTPKKAENCRNCQIPSQNNKAQTN